jgi:hypothetical protein
MIALITKLEESGGNMTSIRAVIPLFPKHLIHVPDVLSDLAAQSIPNDAVILVASGFNLKEYARTTRINRKYDFLNIVILRFVAKMSYRLIGQTRQDR